MSPWSLCSSFLNVWTDAAWWFVLCSFFVSFGVSLTVLSGTPLFPAWGVLAFSFSVGLVVFSLGVSLAISKISLYPGGMRAVVSPG